MVGVFEIEGIVEFLNRCIVLRRVRNRMMWYGVLSLIGCHCREYQEDGHQGKEGEVTAKGNDRCMAAKHMKGMTHKVVLKKFCL